MDDKELLNIILYEKRFITYGVCFLMIVVGVLLGLVKVPDSQLREAVSNRDMYIYKEDIPKDLNLIKEDDVYYVFCDRGDKNQIKGVYFGDNYQKINLKDNNKCKVKNPEKGNITGYVVLGRSQ